MPVQESWLVVHVFCPTSSSHSLELAEPPACAHLPWARRTDGGFGGEEVRVSAHALQGPRCSALLFVLGRRHRNTPFAGSSQYLARHRPWLGAGCLGWRAGGQAGNGDCSKPNSSLAPAPAQHSHQHREGTGLAC